MTEELRPVMTEEERAFHELGEDGVIADAPDTGDTGDATSDDGDDVVTDDPADGEPS